MAKICKLLLNVKTGCFIIGYAQLIFYLGGAVGTVLLFNKSVDLEVQDKNLTDFDLTVISGLFSHQAFVTIPFLYGVHRDMPKHMIPWMGNSLVINVFFMCVEGPQPYLHAKNTKDKLFYLFEYVFITSLLWMMLYCGYIHYKKLKKTQQLKFKDILNVLPN